MYTSSSSASEICGAGSTSLLLFLIGSGLFTLRGWEGERRAEVERRKKKGRRRCGKGKGMYTYTQHERWLHGTLHVHISSDSKHTSLIPRLTWPGNEAILIQFHYVHTCSSASWH